MDTKDSDVSPVAPHGREKAGAGYRRSAALCLVGPSDPSARPAIKITDLLDAEDGVQGDVGPVLLGD